jgi:hypothetical protein
MRDKFLIAGILAIAVACFADKSLAGSRPFTVYDNLFYQGKPDTTKAGLVVSNILYEEAIWPHKVNYGKLPKQSAFEATVIKSITNLGPLVLDIEHLPLTGDAKTVQQHLHTLEKLADWAREAAPGREVGFFGTHTLQKVDPADVADAHRLARHVDALFPELYTHGSDQDNWKKDALAAVAEAHALAPGKPVYLYLWPQYVTGSKHQFEYFSSAYWQFELSTSRDIANGVVLWSPSRFAWDDSSGWWEATEKFIRG